MMDLGGPKLRTAELALRPPALKLQQQSDVLGAIQKPARLAKLKPGMCIDITDAITALDVILRRMACHQDKKRPLLRALQARSGRAPTHFIF